MLIDTGCTGAAVGRRFAEKLGKDEVFVRKDAGRVKIRQGDGSVMKGGELAVASDIKFGFSGTQRKLEADVLELGDRDVIVGMSWLQENGAQIDCEKYSVTFRDGEIWQCEPYPLPTVTLGGWEDVLEEAKCLMLLAADDLPLFKKLADPSRAARLPSHTEFDHHIQFKPGEKAPNGPLYKLTWEEEQALVKYLDQMTLEGKIRRSSSQASSPIIFVKKKDGSLRLCVDYRRLNTITEKDVYPLPLITELHDRLEDATIFTKLDLKNGYNLIRIATGDEWKTAFKTKYGLYEYLVMPFGLTNAPATFQRMIDTTLGGIMARNEPGHGVAAYIDDILIYTKGSREEHAKLVNEVLKALDKAGLAVNGDKSEVFQEQVDFLGHVVGKGMIGMEESKVRAVKEWKSPSKKRELQEFLGFTNYYRKFVERYSDIAKPLTRLTGNVEWEWTPTEQNAFQALKNALTTAPILRQFKRGLPTRMETDASNQAVAAVLEQQHDEDWYPVDYHSSALTQTQRNWPIHDKELWAIVSALDKWRPMLAGFHTDIYTDHHGLKYFLTKPRLNMRQAAWASRLADFDFTINYKPGKETLRADALSRAIDGGVAGSEEAMFQEGQLLVSEMVGTDESEDVEMQEPIADERLSWDKMEESGLLLVPEDKRVEILAEHHDSGIAGHWGIARTQELITRNYWWPEMRKTIEEYISKCDRCQRAKPDRHARTTALRPMPVGNGPWQEIGMDFVVGLPLSEGFDAILVVIDRFSKYARYIPCHSTWNSEKLANAFVREIWCHFGLPKAITSDRDPRMASQMWKDIHKQLGIRLRMSTAHHPQTDGLSERAIQTLSQYLRLYTHDRQEDWHNWLPMAEFAYNNSVNRHGYTPFRAVLGYDPTTIHLAKNEESKSLAAEAWLARMENVHREIHQLLRQEKKARASKAPPGKAREFEIGEQVLVDRRNLTIREGTRKLSDKYIGPFTVAAKVGSSAYRLELPKRIRMHNVIHVSLLKPYKSRPGLEWRLEDIAEEGKDLEYDVEGIIDSRKRRSGVVYRTRWLDCTEEEDTWEPWDNLKGSEETEALLRKFHEEHPNKPRDPRV